LGVWWGLGFRGSSVWVPEQARGLLERFSYVRLIDFVYHSTLGVRIIKKKKFSGVVFRVESLGFRVYGLRVCRLSPLILLLLYYSQA